MDPTKICRPGPPKDWRFCRVNPPTSPLISDDYMDSSDYSEDEDFSSFSAQSPTNTARSPDEAEQSDDIIQRIETRK